MQNVMRIEARAFPNAAPVVRYEVDSSDLLINVNDAWQTFAIGNEAAHLVRERVLGQSLWDFVSDDITRLVYDVILRQVRNGARSRFEYRCDSPDRRRLMEMTIAPGHAGHVVFESSTVCVEWHRDPPVVATPTLARWCGWCKRAHNDGHEWVDLGLASAESEPGRGRTPVLTDGMCSDCYSRVMNSIDDRGAAHAVVSRRASVPVHRHSSSSRPSTARRASRAPQPSHGVPLTSRRAS